jgi:sulfate permease, SulP family
MSKTKDEVVPFAPGWETANETWSRWIARGRDGLRDTVAGIVAAVVLIANIVSFGALMFPGDLSAGIPIVVWSMLIGACICGVWIALTTSLPPIATGIDSPTGTVLVLLGASAGTRIIAAGGSPQAAAETVMLLFTIATLLSGAMFYLLGACRWGAYFRFVPSSVVGGFLAATGCFLIAGGIRMITARALSFHALAAPWTFNDAAKLGIAIAALAVLLTLRLRVKWALAVPAALLMMLLGLVAALRLLGMAGAQYGWYFHSLGTLRVWSPLTAVYTSHLTWSTLGHLIPELFAMLVVGLISLITKVSSVEISRHASGDLDRELRAHGLGSIIAAPFGGLTSSVQVGTSRLLEHAGGATRMSGVVCAVVMGIVGVAHFDLPGLVPIPLVGGLVFYLGYSFIADALWRPYSQRAWFDLLFTVGIAIVCLQYGYLIGVLAGLVCACMLFIMSYARLGVIRRHASRAQIASHVDRPSRASEYLPENGDDIQIYWLSGYIFFGSSESIFERIKADMEALHPRQVAYLILDFGLVSGADTSAIVSLGKLRRFCKERNTTLVLCSLSTANRGALERGGFLDQKQSQHVFSDFNSALAWCEDQMLAKAKLELDVTLDAFKAWFQRQLGSSNELADLMAYLERKDVDDGQVIYRQGDSAETLELVSVGRLNVEVTDSGGKHLRMRRIATHTVIGEMGFFRKSVRSASISSDGPTTLYTLTRANFDRMRHERPDLAGVFRDFIVRTLADRVESQDRKIVALAS